MAKQKKVEDGNPFAKLKALRDKLAPTPAATVRKPASPTKSAPPQVDDEDAVSFERLFQGVKPLQGSSSVAAARRNAAMAEENDSAKARLARLVSEAAPFEVTDDGQHVEGRRTDVPIGEMRRLRRGQRPIDARLDLHGKAAHEAGEALADFVARMHERHERCLLVIFGKGLHSPGGKSVLRGEVATWLSQGAPSVHVSAFVTATDEDGGTGAVYVLLKN